MRILRIQLFDQMKFNNLIPELGVSDFNESFEFYTTVLGFKAEYIRESFAFLSLQGSQLMIEQMNDAWNVGKLEKPFGRGINFQIMVADVDVLLKRLAEHKIVLFSELKENWYKKDNILIGQKEFLVQDPDGYLLRFAQDIGTKKA